MTDEVADVLADSELTHDRLTADVTVYQRRGGHRFSSDDVVTAWMAAQVAPTAQRVLDIGCGLGSVLLHLAWSLPHTSLVGVEAQAISFALLQRNVATNNLSEQVAIHHGDLRDNALLDSFGAFDLVTGTPPYFPVDTATDAMDEQRAYARIEYRGGIEAYIAAAERRMTSDGWFVVCADSDAEPRLQRAAVEHDLGVVRRSVVIPRDGRPPLFTVWALRRTSTVEHAADDNKFVDRPLTMRDANGERTADARMIRAFSGFPEKHPH